MVIEDVARRPAHIRVLSHGGFASLHVRFRLPTSTGGPRGRFAPGRHGQSPHRMILIKATAACQADGDGTGPDAVPPGISDAGTGRGVRMGRLVATTRILLAGLLTLALLAVPVVSGGVAHPAAHGTHDACVGTDATAAPSRTALGDDTPCPPPPVSGSTDASCCVSAPCVPALAALPAGGMLAAPSRAADPVALAPAGLPEGVGVPPALPPPRITA
ncbi:hypothetical protein [Azospirillum sp. ST 5-10]|uniref:hypothetical protein n=1 Tax=unclassified Azospirillum TaxID=2630922 RepID=UPI003F4A64C7